MMYGHEEYWLFYSAANFQLPTYRMMVARSKDLMGPYVKGDVPVVETDWERLILRRLNHVNFPIFIEDTTKVKTAHLRALVMAVWCWTKLVTGGSSITAGG